MRAGRSYPARNRRVSSTVLERKKLVLDVKTRRVTARRQRSRKFWRWFWLVTLSLTSSAVLWLFAQTALERFFFNNPDYELARIEISHPDVLSPADLKHLAGIEGGQNVFLIDLAMAERELEKVPEIAVARVARVLPDTLTVDLEVRDAVAWVKDVDSPEGELPVLLADSEGRLYRPRKALPVHLDLPVIEGVKTAGVMAGDLLSGDDLKRALELVETARANDSLPFTLRMVDIRRGHVFEVELGSGARVVFAPENFGAQLERLSRLVQVARQAGRDIEEANLAVRRQTPVRFAMRDAGRKAEADFDGAWLEEAADAPMP